MVFENVLIQVLETAVAQATKEGKAPSHQFLAAVKGKDRSAIPGSKRLVECEVRYKTDVQLAPGEYIATLSVSAYSVGGNTGESCVILAAVPKK